MNDTNAKKNFPRLWNVAEDQRTSAVFHKEFEMFDNHYWAHLWGSGASNLVIDLIVNQLASNNTLCDLWGKVKFNQCNHV